MEQSLDFDFKVEILQDIQVSVGDEYSDLFLTTPIKNEIFITDVQNDTEDLISHEITEPEYIIQNNIVPYRQLPRDVCRAKFINDTIICNNNDPEEITRPPKIFAEFSELNEVDPAAYTPTFAYWKEGNISTLKSWCVIPQKLLQRCYEQDDSKRCNLNKQQFNGHTKLFLCWNAVNSRIRQLGIESHAKFVLDYKQESFHKVQTPLQFRNIVFEMEPFEKTVDIRIPFTGVPLMFIGRLSMKCQHRKKLKTKNKTDPKTTGCSAAVDVLKIMRFPDYDISYFKPGSEADIIKELTEAITVSSDSIRHYMEYYMKEAGPEDHHDHTGENCRPVLPINVEDKIEEMLKQGVDSSLINKRTFQNSNDEVTVKQITKRNKYDPTARAIRYMKTKAQKKLQASKVDTVKSECEDLIAQIAMLTDWTELKDRLQTMRDSSIFSRTSEIILDDGINLDLQSVAQDDVQVDINQIQVSEPVVDIPNITDVWNPINFVSCTDQQWQGMVFSRNAHLAEDDFCQVDSVNLGR